MRGWSGPGEHALEWGRVDRNSLLCIVSGVESVILNQTSPRVAQRIL